MRLDIKNILYILLLPIFISLICIERRALITGVSGQDGYYLAQFLRKKGYEVHGIKRITTASMQEENEIDNVIYHFCDLDDSGCLMRLVKEIEPDEIYNLAVQSQIHVTYLVPEYSARSNAFGALNILEAIRNSGLAHKTRFFQAASSEIFGRTTSVISEESALQPCSFYGVAKLFAYWITRNYRESYGIFACNGILFNHESPRRGETFVTRKITRAVARIKYGQQEILSLGNLDVQKDWGYAKDYVEAMWLILQQEVADDYIIATGQSHTVHEFVEEAFDAVGINITWQGEGVDEIGINAETGKVCVKVDPRYFRPIDTVTARCDIAKAREVLKWQPKTNFKQLVKIMVDHDVRELLEM